jgi:hypothetical protein
MSLEERAFELKHRSAGLFDKGFGSASAREMRRLVRNAIRLQRKYNAALDKSEKRGEAWIGVFYGKPN